MNVILLKNNDTNRADALYTVSKFIQKANDEYYKKYNHYANPEDLNVIDWYIETLDNLSIDIIQLDYPENL